MEGGSRNVGEKQAATDPRPKEEQVAGLAEDLLLKIDNLHTYFFGSRVC